MDSDRLVTDCFFDLLQQVGQLHDALLAEALSVIIQQTDEKQALRHIKTGLHNRHICSASQMIRWVCLIMNLN